MSEFYWSSVIHGPSKSGKTELAATSPGRILYLDSEAGGFRFVEGKRIAWDPMRGEVPEAGPWKICRVVIKDEITFKTALDFVERGKHPFNSIVWDSVTEAQTYFKRDKSATYTLRQEDWGDLLASVEGYIMRLRDAVETQDQLKALVVIAQSAARDDGKMSPAIQGAMKNKLAYKLDVTGYLTSVIDSEGEERRGLRLTENREAVAGARWPKGLPKPEVVWDPSIEVLQATIEQHMKEHN